MGATEERAALAAGVCAALEAGCSGSRARLRGSLATGTADEFSDIDVEWVVPDAGFSAAVAVAPELLGRGRPVADVRVDPDFRHSDRRRLLFVRFAGVSLFWRLDLSVRAASIADDADDDVGNPAARAAEGEWSRPASALANAVGAVKALGRHRPGDARGLLDRGFARIGEDDSATGAWAADIGRLARAAALRDPALAELSGEVVTLAARYLGGTGV
jgi:predicted nucleotidyltransferase